MSQNKNGSQGADLGTRLNAHQDAYDTSTVQTALPLRHPAAFVSLYAPHAGRRTWWYAHVCDHCGYGHQGQLRRAIDEDSATRAVQGVRRSRCGRLLWFVVARVYRGQASEVAA